MSKFASSAQATGRGPVQTLDPDTHTHEGGTAKNLDAKGELFTLAITNFVEPTFYESNRDRQSRFVQSVHLNTQQDPEWTARLIAFSRQTMNMRSASVVMACEYVAAGGPNGRKVIDSVCVRADEPAEVIGYWIANHGRTIPKPVKRGVADAVRRLYNERNALKYDSSNSAVRMADVIELTHARPKDEYQSALFKYLIDTRHKRERFVPTPGIAAIGAWIREGAPVSSLPKLMSWERLSTYTKMDKAAWEAVIPQMGAMALVRNLRNFDEQGVDGAAYDAVVAKITSADDIRASRMFPFRMWTAYREAPSKRWAWPLEQALRHSCSNVPNLDGDTLVMVDVSGSMDGPISNRSTVTRWEVAGVFAGAMAQACGQVKIVPFATNCAQFYSRKGEDVLTVCETINGIARSGQLAHGTNIWQSLDATWAGEKRVVIFTDMQAHDSYRVNQDKVPFIYAFDLAGYGRTGLDLSTPGRYQLGGFSDACFQMMEVLESGRSGTWPF